VGAVRILAAGDAPANPQARVVAQLQDPHQPLIVKQGEGPNTIEVQFANALVDLHSVVAGQSFVMEGAGGIQAGTIVPLPNNTVRFTVGPQLQVFPIGQFKITLVGSVTLLPVPGGQRAIVSQAGLRLDGEATQLPSGNGQEGGSFVFALQIA
jgi:hypothetical protein